MFTTELKPSISKREISPNSAWLKVKARENETNKINKRLIQSKLQLKIKQRHMKHKITTQSKLILDYCFHIPKLPNL